MSPLARGILLVLLSVGLWRPTFAEQAKQSVVVDTRPSANGILGADVVAKSAPDGYTIFIGTNSTAELTALAKKEPDKLNYGWASSSTRVAVKLYKQIMDLKITDVPYKTLPQATTDLVGGFVTAALNTPRMKEFLINAGSEPFPTTREELMRFQVAEHDKWHRVIVGAGIDPA